MLTLPVMPDSAEPRGRRPVPNVSGATLRRAANALHRRGFQVAVRGGGLVQRTTPAAGDSAALRIHGDLMGGVTPRRLRVARGAAAPGWPADRGSGCGSGGHGLTADSRVTRPGMVYVAVRGSQADGHRFVPDAVGRGAIAVVVEQPAVRRRTGTGGAGRPAGGDRRWAGSGTAILVGSSYWSASPAPTARPPRPPWCGISSTPRPPRAASARWARSTGGASRAESTAGSLTTPGPIDLQATLARAASAGGCTHVAMETSSHSLDQGRLDGLTLRGRESSPT